MDLHEGEPLRNHKRQDNTTQTLTLQLHYSYSYRDITTLVMLHPCHVTVCVFPEGILEAVSKATVTTKLQTTIRIDLHNVILVQCDLSVSSL